MSNFLCYRRMGIKRHNPPVVIHSQHLHRVHPKPLIEDIVKEKFHHPVVQNEDPTGHHSHEHHVHEYHARKQLSRKNNSTENHVGQVISYHHGNIRIHDHLHDHGHEHRHEHGHKHQGPKEPEHKYIPEGVHVHHSPNTDFIQPHHLAHHHYNHHNREVDENNIYFTEYRSQAIEFDDSHHHTPRTHQ